MASLELCNASDVDPGTSKLVELDNYPPLAVFNVDGEYFVINDTCSHGDASLCDGEIEDGEVSCPWHNAKFCIKTGKALTFPAVEAQKSYETSIVDGKIVIDI
jgi:nitrite reductase/ring-hydroxylating ferredoxin subunit